VRRSGAQVSHRSMVACMRWRTTSGPDWKFIEAVTEDGTRLYACRRSARPKARRSRSALRRSGWRSSSEMAQAWEQKEQHQQSVTSEPLIVCSGRTEPLWLQDGQRSGIRNSSCTHEPYQVSGQGARDNGRQPLQFRCDSGVALAQPLPNRRKDPGSGRSAVSGNLSAEWVRYSGGSKIGGTCARPGTHGPSQR